ncbi:MAG: glycosyltransferase 87 family protein [Terriglobales bacterium]
MLLALLRNSTVGLLLALLLAGSMWFYVRRVLVPYQRADAALHGRPRGNLSDLYPRWLGARELLLRHQDPYSAEITREIQTGYYGRPLNPTRPSDPKDEEGFAYPVYVVFLLAPSINLPFAVVQAGFRWLLLLLTAISVPLWLRAIGYRPRWVGIAILIILTLGSFPAAQGLELQQLSLLVSVLIAVCLVLIACDYLWLAGIVLAVTTIKPQLVLPLVGWLGLWALSNWKKRRKLIFGFGLTMLALVVGGELILPGWIGSFMHAVAAYRRYTNSKSILDVLTTEFLGRLLAAIVIVVVANRCWEFRRDSQDTIYFALASSLVLAATIVIVPTIAPYNQLLLLPGIFLLAGNQGILSSKNLSTRVLGIVAAAIVFWSWIAAVGLTLASFVLPPARVQQAWAIPFYTSIATPLAVLGLLFQYAFQALRSGGSQAASGLPE